jgi:hypothetical protein
VPRNFQEIRDEQLRDEVYENNTLELEFTRKDKSDYKWYLNFEGPEAAAKPRTKKKKLGEAQQTRSKAKRTRRAS